jgi:hypothetical protein
MNLKDTLVGPASAGSKAPGHETRLNQLSSLLFLLVAANLNFATHQYNNALQQYAFKIKRNIQYKIP